MSERDVNGKHFVFVGGTQGMGRAAALALAERGAAILLVGRNAQAGAIATAEMLKRGAASADFLAADISTVAGIRSAADGIRAWRPTVHGLMHTAMSAFNKKIITDDDLEFAFALQYFARAALNRLLIDHLAASGDGRIVHVAGNVSESMAGVDLDDLQFEHRKWTFFKSILGTHYLGFLHLQEAAKQHADLPVSFTAACVESVKTQVMLDPHMPWIMRLMGRFGTSPQLAARNAITVLTTSDSTNLKAAIVPKSKKYEPQPFELDSAAAAKLWDITTGLATKKGLLLPV